MDRLLFCFLSVNPPDVLAWFHLRLLHDLALWHSLLQDHMKIPYVAFCTSVLGSSFYAHSLCPARVFARNTSLASELINTTLSNVTLGEQSCRPKYGTEFTSTNCTNAWEIVLQDRENYTYGLRADIAAGAHFDVGQPVPDKLSVISAKMVSAPLKYTPNIIPLHNLQQDTRQGTSMCLKPRKLCLTSASRTDIREGS